MMRGTVGFSARRRSVLSAIIRWLTRSKWSHTFVLYQAKPEALVIEAGRFQVQIVPLTKYGSRRKWRTAYFEPVGYGEDDIARGLSRLRRQIEAPYGWFQLLGFVPVTLVRRLLGLKIPNPIKGGVVCSELVLEYLRGLDGGSEWYGMDKNTTDPEMIFERLVSHSKFRRVNYGAGAGG